MKNTVCMCIYLYVHTHAHRKYKSQRAQNNNCNILDKFSFKRCSILAHLIKILQKYINICANKASSDNIS